MAGTTTTPPAHFWTRVQADMARDPRKTVLMLVLAVVAVIVAVRLVGQGHSMPAPAAAAVAIVPSPAMSGKAGAARSDHSPARKGNEQEQRENYLARLDRNINRDLFKTGAEYFPAPGGAEEDSTDASAAHGGWLGDMAEQLRQQQQAQRERLEQMAAIRAQAQGLNLQSTILGSTPTALINGQPLHVGQSINGFVITEITPNACRLTREGVSAEIRMKK